MEAQKNNSAIGTDLTTRFALKLIAQFRDGHNNVVFSPLSIFCAVAMLRAGAAGPTRAAIDTTLDTQGLADEQFDAAIVAMTKSLASHDPEIVLSIANALWADRSFTFRTDFLLHAENIFGAHAATLDLPNAVPTINAWVSQHTNGEIDDLLSLDSLQGALAVLTNAVYFKGNWTEQFDRDLTQTSEFNLADGSQCTVSMMNLTEWLPYRETATTKTIALPYGKGDFSLYVVLPKNGTTLDDVLIRLTPATLVENFTYLPTHQVQLSLPRFELSPEPRDIAEILVAGGMAPVFTDDADFFAMSNEPLKVGRILHKTVLKVDEEGTTAAATADEMLAGITQPPTMLMNVNRPFLCAIRNNSMRQVLFLAAVYNPNG